ncbi:MAG: DUF393 domain-containing protein [Chitinophagaceae bacterium]|nr:MAG: DUF393 domain-containing protein [Chitinophagaceae bacterium]
MKTLIYDNECPLCVGYTALFMHSGLLEKEGRQHFNEVQPEFLELLDKNKMHNEIPLIEKETGKVWYGIDALLELLGQRCVMIKKIGSMPPINWLLKKVYAFISFNRKVIVAASPGNYDCSPAFSLKYRLLFLLFGLVVNSWLFNLYMPLFNKSIFPGASADSMEGAHFIFIAVNVCTGLFLGRRKGIEFLGQVNMLAFIILLLLIPVNIFQHFIPPAYLCFLFGSLTFFVVKEYIRRMRYAGIMPQQYSVVMLNVISVSVFFLYLVSR